MFSFFYLTSFLEFYGTHRLSQDDNMETNKIVKYFVTLQQKKILPNLLYDKLPQCSKVIYLESISIEDINNINPYISSFPESWKVTTFINICKSTSVKTAIIQKLEASGKSAGKENINIII